MTFHVRLRKAQGKRLIMSFGSEEVLTLSSLLDGYKLGEPFTSLAHLTRYLKVAQAGSKLAGYVYHMTCCLTGS
jgi:hypothetical protein